MISLGERFGIRIPAPLYVVWLLSVTADVCQHTSGDVRILAAAAGTRDDTLLRLALQDHGGDRQIYFWDTCVWLCFLRGYTGGQCTLLNFGGMHIHAVHSLVYAKAVACGPSSITLFMPSNKKSFMSVTKCNSSELTPTLWESCSKITSRRGRTVQLHRGYR